MSMIVSRDTTGKWTLKAETYEEDVAIDYILIKIGKGEMDDEIQAAISQYNRRPIGVGLYRASIPKNHEAQRQKENPYPY